MKPIKTILVATDFSDASQKAMQAAAAMAEQFGATLHIVHVLQPPNYLLPEAYLAYSPQMFGETLRGLGKLLAAAKEKAKQAGAPDVKGELLQGVVANEIVGYAAAHDCDLVIVGTHGRTGVVHAVLGSVAEKVVRTSSRPVLTVPGLQAAA